MDRGPKCVYVRMDRSVPDRDVPQPLPGGSMSKPVMKARRQPKTRNDHSASCPYKIGLNCGCIAGERVDREYARSVIYGLKQELTHWQARLKA